MDQGAKCQAVLPARQQDGLRQTDRQEERRVKKRVRLLLLPDHPTPHCPSTHKATAEAPSGTQKIGLEAKMSDPLHASWQASLSRVVYGLHLYSNWCNLGSETGSNTSPVRRRAAGRKAEGRETLSSTRRSSTSNQDMLQRTLNGYRNAKGLGILGHDLSAEWPTGGQVESGPLLRRRGPGTKMVSRDGRHLPHFRSTSPGSLSNMQTIS